MIFGMTTATYTLVHMLLMAQQRARCTISTKIFRASAGLFTSFKNPIRAPRMPSGVFNRT